MARRHLSWLLAAGLVLGMSGTAAAHHPDDGTPSSWSTYDPADGPALRQADKGAGRYDNGVTFVSNLNLDRLALRLVNVEGGLSRVPYQDPREGQHGPATGHLAPSSKNVQLVGKLDTLTDVTGGIADVAAFGNYAYLNAFSPECAGRPGAQGTGVHVVDISDPTGPAKVNFLPAETNSYVGEGIHVIDFNGRNILVHNNETCNAAQPVTSGFAVWDVTDPVAATKLGQFGDTTPAVANQTFHTTHSVQGFVWQGKAYAVAQDNQDLNDVDIFDITPAINGTGPAVLVWEGGLELWPAAHTPLANGDSVFHHDMQQKVIDGHNYLLVSYWDAGQVLLNIDNPASPVFVADSDFSSPDLAGFTIAEGNSHQSYWSSDGKYALSSDEDFSPTRTLCRILTGPHAGPTACGEFGFSQPLGSTPIEGPTVWGGSGCVEDLNGNSISDRAEVPEAAGPNQIVVFSRGTCFFSDKIRSGEEAGYTAVAVANSHGGSRNGLVGDGFLCGGQGSPVLGTAKAICIGHRAMHQLFEDAVQFAGPEFADMPSIGTLGATLRAQGGVFDGWGYVRLHRGDTLEEIDQWAIDEALDPAFASGFGNLTVHEVKTDPRAGKNLAYFSYYDAGLRVATFGEDGIKEVGHYIAEGGNDFWGVFPVCTGGCANTKAKAGKNGKAVGQNPYLLMSDRDSGLWIFRYT
ncbi:MAG: hypothetical protein M3245_06055, partial [Actinomycetota bacterium]|nr:hypothetical protein [Actinomycetota bacterium]